MDSFGRVRIFHGVNAVYKVAPYVPLFDHFDPQESLSLQDVHDLYDWGFNFVRLGAMWPGVEAIRGQYNTTYLAQLEQIVDALAQKDIYTLLDCHQDLLSPQFCGEGVPDWAAIPAPKSLPFPLPALGFETLPRDNKTGYGPESTTVAYAARPDAISSGQISSSFSVPQEPVFQILFCASHKYSVSKPVRQREWHPGQFCWILADRRGILQGQRPHHRL